MTAAQKTAKAKFKQAIAYRQKTGVSLKEAFAHIYGRKVGAVKTTYGVYVYGSLVYETNDILIANAYAETYKKRGQNAIVKKIPKNKVGAVKKKPYKGYQYTIDENETGNFVDKYFTLTEAKKDLKKLESNSKKSGKYKKDFYRITDLNSGKTIGAIKKKAAKKVVRKVVKKKAAPKKKVVKKKLTSRDYDKRYSALKPGKRTSASGNTYYEYRGNRSDKGRLLGIGFTLDKYNRLKKLIKVAPQVKKNIKRIINKKLQNTRSYFGIETKNDLILKRIKEASSDLNTYYNYIDGYKNLSMQDKKNKKVQYKHISNLIKETKTHIKELKKSL